MDNENEKENNGVNEPINLDDIFDEIDAEELEYKCDYIALADDATEQVALAYDDFGRCIAEYALAKDKLLSIKHLIEDKKNKMIAAGTVTGKNAEERAANAWIAIPEYDDLVVLESNANTARANLEISKTKLAAWKSRLDFYMQMVALVSSRPLLGDDGDDSWLDDFDEDCIS